MSCNSVDLLLVLRADGTTGQAVASLLGSPISIDPISGAAARTGRTGADLTCGVLLPGGTLDVVEDTFMASQLAHVAVSYR